MGSTLGGGRRLIAVLVVMTMAALLAASGFGVSLYRRAYAAVPLPAVPPLNVMAQLYDTTPTTVVLTADWHKVSITVPRWEFLADHTLWRRMHFEDWDRLPRELRAQGLGRLLDRYGHLAVDRRAWASMTAGDWDRVPQPVRAMAFIGMLEHWVGQYRVGEAYGLDPAEVLRTVKAVAMSESWFDHRAFAVNADGSADIGLGGASDYARRTVRRWYEEGRADFMLADEDYANPWLATRWTVLWFALMLQEADGDLPLAVRAYNVGIGRARAGRGGDYYETVARRRSRYFAGPSGSPTWALLSQFQREAGRGGADPVNPPNTVLCPGLICVQNM